MWLSFLFVDVLHSRKLLTRWKPQFAAETLLSVINVQEYVNARISMESDCIGSLISEQGEVMFVLGPQDEDRIPIKCIVAQSTERKLQVCRELRAWILVYCPHIRLDTHALTENDKLFWELSKHDP